jgi:ribosomal protein L7Ae-like RNA K-turn-binding protein
MAAPRAQKRKSLADDMSGRRKSAAFKADLNAVFNFRWPVLNDVDSGVVLLKLQDDPGIRALASRATQRSDATAAMRTAARKRCKQTGSNREGQPIVAAMAKIRKADRRSRALERQEQAQHDIRLPIIGLSAVGRALERGELAAVVICRDSLLHSVSSGAPSPAAGSDSGRREASSVTTDMARMVAHIPGLCHRYGTALCCLSRSIDTSQFGRTVGQRRCVAIGIARAGVGGENDDTLPCDDEQRETFELYEWLQRRCPPPKIGWLPSRADHGWD